MPLRTETDIIGEVKIPSTALYGVHSSRAKENFPSSIPFSIDWYKATGTVKLACYNTYSKFRDEAVKKFGKIEGIRLIGETEMAALVSAAGEVSRGDHFENFIVPAVQGGAGTSINMNVNEIIANRALVILGKKPGDYKDIDPVEHANIFQSTNDVIPTALTVAAMRLLSELEGKINLLRQKTEELERKGRNKLRPGYTQMQEAVPSSFGILFSAWNEALSRDWWRVSKCSERLKQVNLGGGAIGTGIAVPRFFIMEAVPELRRLTSLPLAQSENLPDATSNLDRWVEIHATLKANAVNLEKMVSDIRLLSSDITGSKLLEIPPRQTGSSIMPGKINPVIPEFVISSSHKIYANDQLIASLCGLGTLELNAYLPVIGHAVLETLNLLTGSCQAITDGLLTGIAFKESEGLKALLKSPSITTALVPFVGYNNASSVAKLMKEKDIDIYEACKITGTISSDKLEKILDPASLLKLGFSLGEL